VACGVVVSLVEAQVLRAGFGRWGTFYDDRVDGPFQQFAVMHVGPGHNDAQRSAVGFDD